MKKFFDVGISTETCNLRCHYCYITQKRKFNNSIVKFNHSKEEIRKALSRERLGGNCMFNFCACGETLLSDELLPIIQQLLLEGHYVMIVTNGTLTNRFTEITQWSEELRNRLFIKFSYHFLEMKRLGLTEKFFSNVNLMKNNGVSFTVEVTPSDELIPYIDELKAVCMDNVGALCHITIARNELTEDFRILTSLDREEYVKTWGQFHSEFFDFKNSIFGVKRKEFCYAGVWSYSLLLDTGDLKQCVYEKTIDNIYENIDRPLKAEAVGHKCSMAHCWNGHAYLGFGVIPEMKTPTYTVMRNRICEDGTEWLTPTMKTIMDKKLVESNKEYNWFEKITNKKPLFIIAKEYIKRILKPTRKT